jgi:hypothetical protein
MWTANGVRSAMGDPHPFALVLPGRSIYPSQERSRGTTRHANSMHPPLDESVLNHNTSSQGVALDVRGTGEISRFRSF